MNKRNLILLLILFFNRAVNAQTTDLHKYLNNIVELGGGEFGTIIGNNQKDYYFITVSTEGSSPIIDEVRFYKSKFIYKATFIKRFQIDNLYVNLYVSTAKEDVSWQNYSYSSLTASHAFYSFLDNDKTDSVWYINSSKIISNDILSKNVFQLKVSRDDKFYLGFPVVNELNEIVGIIAESQTNENDSNATDQNLKTIFPVIDIQAIEQKLYDYSNCKYFQLVKTGQAGTPCDIENKVKQEKKHEEEKAKSNNQIYGVASGLSFTTFLSIGANYGTVGFGLGYNIFLNPDKGKVKVTLKPRLSYVPFKLSSDSNNLNTVIDYQTKKTRLYTAEMPIMLEFITKRSSSDFEWILGLGYVPVYQSSLTYLYTTSSDKSLIKATDATAQGYKSKVAIEWGGFSGKNHLVFYATYQLSPWHDWNYHTVINNEVIYPTQSYGLHYTQIGLELSFRHKGSWELKANPQ